MLARVKVFLGAPLPTSPDGDRYLAMARGIRQPRPFMYRVFVPYTLGTSPRAWRLCAYGCFVYLGVLGWAYTGAWAAFFMPFGLAGLRVQTKAPVLVDLPAMVFALASTGAMRDGHWIVAAINAVLAGMTKETAPLFAAAWAWSPLPLVGLAVPVCIAIFRKPGVDTLGGHAGEALSHPIKTALDVRRGQRVFGWYVLPLGVLILGFAYPSPQLAVAVALAYGQLLVATDLVRLYVWAWPALALSMFDAVPRGWWPVLVVAHLASPWKGEGW